MNLSKNIVFKSFFESFKIIRNKKYYILYPIIIDLLFILSYGFFMGFFIGNIQEKAVALIQTGKSILSSGGLIKGLLTNKEAVSIILFTFGFMITIYVIYSIFQGINWRFAKKFVKKNIPLLVYIKKFFLVNIFWFILFFLIQFSDYIRRLLSYLSKGTGLSTSFISGNIVINILIFLIVYFAFISYALISKYKIIQAIKKSFAVGITGIKHILPMYLIVFIIFLIINLLLILLSKINFTLMIIFGIITVLPAFTWVRVFVNLVVGKVD